MHVAEDNLISCLQDNTRDIFLDGIVARNRALNGDVVVVQILPQDQWKVENLQFTWGRRPHNFNF